MEEMLRLEEVGRGVRKAHLLGVRKGAGSR